jgi:hypothetical protein
LDVPAAAVAPVVLAGAAGGLADHFGLRSHSGPQ